MLPGRRFIHVLVSWTSEPETPIFEASDPAFSLPRTLTSSHPCILTSMITFLSLAAPPPGAYSDPPPATDILRDLPPEWMIVFGALLLAGLLVWVFGNRLLKAAFVLAGMCLGGGIGFALAVALKLPVPEWMAGVGGSVVLGLFAWLAYRPAMGVCMAILLGLASPAAVIAYAEFRGHHVVTQSDDAGSGDRAMNGNGTPSELERRDLVIEMRELLQRMRESRSLSDETRDLLRERWRRHGEELGLDVGEEEEDGEIALPPWREQFDLLVESIRTEAVARWEAADPGVRRSVVLSAASGAILGLLIGLSLPGIAASLLTAMVGSAAVLFSGWSIITSLHGGVPGWMPSGPGVWVIVWVAMSVAGLALQWTIRREPADKTG